jgi:hypothetical protein
VGVDAQPRARTPHAELKRLADAIADDASGLPGSVRDMGQLYRSRKSPLEIGLVAIGGYFGGDESTGSRPPPRPPYHVLSGSK